MSLVAYMSDALRIFFMSLLAGLLINRMFEIRSRGVTDRKEKLVLGISQFLVVIVTAYAWHHLTSDVNGRDLQLFHPSILMSSFLFNLQDTMIQNIKAAAFRDEPQ